MRLIRDGEKAGGGGGVQVACRWGEREIIYLSVH